MTTFIGQHKLDINSLKLHDLVKQLFVKFAESELSGVKFVYKRVYGIAFGFGIIKAIAALLDPDGSEGLLVAGVLEKIPKDIRNQLELKPGQKLQILNYGDRIEFVPIKDIKKLKGFLKGIDTTIEREKDRI